LDASSRSPAPREFIKKRNIKNSEGCSEACPDSQGKEGKANNDPPIIEGPTQDDPSLDTHSLQKSPQRNQGGLFEKPPGDSFRRFSYP